MPAPLFAAVLRRRRSSSAPSGPDFRADLVALLLDAPAVTAVVSLRVYPLRVPELSARALPALVYQVVDAPRVHHLTGPGGVASARVRLTAVSRNYADCAALAAALRDLLDGYSGTGDTGVVVIETTLHSETDLYDPPADDSGRGVYRTAMDFVFRYREPRSQYLT